MCDCVAFVLSNKELMMKGKESNQQSRQDVIRQPSGFHTTHCPLGGPAWAFFRQPFIPLAASFS